MKINKIHIIFIIWLLCESTVLRADDAENSCSEKIISAIGRKLDLKFLQDYNEKSTPNEMIIKSVCKKWPKDKTKTIAAIFYELSTGVTPLIVSMNDTDSSNVISVYKDNEYTLPVMNLEGISIDTARYNVTTDIRAFGVIFNGSSVVNNATSGGFGSIEALYIQENEKIKPIFEDFFLSTWKLIPCNQCSDGAQREDVGYIIQMSKSITNGYYNLIIKPYSSDSKKKYLEYELIYDGSRYPYFDKYIK
jgi:hypothetical protein